MTSAESEQPPAPTVPSITNKLALAEQNGTKLLAALAPKEVPWQYPFFESDNLSYAGYLTGALKDKHQGYFRLVNEKIEKLGWETIPNGRRGRRPSSMKWFVARGCKCQYTYVVNGAHKILPMDFPRWLVEIMLEAMPLCGLVDRREWPNSCLVHRNSAAMGTDWSSEDDPLFQSTTQGLRVIRLALGGTRSFELRRTGDGSKGHVICNFDLNGGDIGTMEGHTQKHYEHRLSHTGASRVDLTFRWILNHDRCCPRH